MAYDNLLGTWLLSLAMALVACNRGGGGGGGGTIISGRSGVASSTKTATQTQTTTELATSTQVSTQTETATAAATSTATSTASASVSSGADSLTAESLINTSLFVKGTAGETCVTSGFVLKKGESPLEGQTITFAISPAMAVADHGSLTPLLATTGADGRAETTYCSGESEVTVTLTAKHEALSANSAEIAVTKKPEYSLKFSSASVSVDMPENEEDLSKGVLALNLFDSGPRDCAKLTFTILQNDKPFVGAEVAFTTQQDYPKGAKLANKDATGATTTVAETGKKMGSYTATSAGDGTLIVPVCAGVDLGTLLITGTYTATDDRTYTANAPVININAGFVNFANMSLTYDTADAKILKGFFNTNSVNEKHPFTVKLGARGDGEPILDYPVAVSAEFGKVAVSNGGLPKEGEASVAFTVEAQHLINYRPYPVRSYGSSSAQTQCDPVALALESSDVYYKDLAKNWRSTIVYMVRGQESFYDANRNGVYDEGGDGFWDKNQNGIFDGNDVLTYDAGGDNAFSAASEWFIDLPTPFVDANEDGVFDDEVDTLIGDVYQAPNGKRDDDTLIWKYDYLPVWVGTSPIAMLRGVIKHGNLGDITDTIGTDYFTVQANRGLRSALSSVPTKLWGQGISTTSFYDSDSSGSVSTTEAENGAARYYYFFAHDKCGSPPPGGTKIKLTVQDTAAAGAPQEATYGARAITGHIYMQPGDSALEPSSRFLKDAAGSNEATVNFNVTEHGSASASYPVEFKIRVGPCTRQCGGAAVVTNGVACAAATAAIGLSFDADTIWENLPIPAVKTCVCGTDALFTAAGDCDCPTGKPNFTGTACTP